VTLQRDLSHQGRVDPGGQHHDAGHPGDPVRDLPACVHARDRHHRGREVVAKKQTSTKKATASENATAPKKSAPGKRRGDEPFRTALTFDAEHPDRASTYGAQERVLDVL